MFSLRLLAFILVILACLSGSMSYASVYWVPKRTRCILIYYVWAMIVLFHNEHAPREQAVSIFKTLLNSWLTLKVC